MFLVAGLAMIVLGVGMVFLARPRDGTMVSFLSLPYAEITYSLLVTILIGVGVTATLGGLASLAGS